MGDQLRSHLTPHTGTHPNNIQDEQTADAGLPGHPDGPDGDRRPSRGGGRHGAGGGRHGGGFRVQRGPGSRQEEEGAEQEEQEEAWQEENSKEGKEEWQEAKEAKGCQEITGWKKQQGLKVRIVQGLHRLHLPDQRDDLPQPDQDPGGQLPEAAGQDHRRQQDRREEERKEGYLCRHRPEDHQVWRWKQRRALMPRRNNKQRSEELDRPGCSPQRLRGLQAFLFTMIPLESTRPKSWKLNFLH